MVTAACEKAAMASAPPANQPQPVIRSPTEVGGMENRPRLFADNAVGGGNFLSLFGS